VGVPREPLMTPQSGSGNRDGAGSTRRDLSWPMAGRKSGWIPEGGELLAGRQVRGPAMPASWRRALHWRQESLTAQTQGGS
jgi:hypothetical protein